jgi:hypothetical protein
MEPRVGEIDRPEHFAPRDVYRGPVRPKCDPVEPAVVSPNLDFLKIITKG